MSTDEWADERADVLARFADELKKVTGDGSKKRQSGEKPPWYYDNTHEGAIFSHITKWKRGELVDPDSGAHPLIHAAWRCLAIACQESGNVPGWKNTDLSAPEGDSGTLVQEAPTKPSETPSSAPEDPFKRCPIHAWRNCPVCVGQVGH